MHAKDYPLFVVQARQSTESAERIARETTDLDARAEVRGALGIRKRGGKRNV